MHLPPAARTLDNPLLSAAIKLLEARADMQLTEDEWDAPQLMLCRFLGAKGVKKPSQWLHDTET
jgi:hypothetical protein